MQNTSSESHLPFSASPSDFARRKGPMVPRTTRVKVQGKVITLYSIGYLAYLCGKTARTMRWYERERLLPKPLIKAPTGVRWYTANELQRYSMIMRTSGIVSGSRSDLDLNARVQLKQAMVNAQQQLRQILYTQVSRIEEVFASKPDVANLARVCSLNRQLKKINATNTEEGTSNSRTGSRKGHAA